MGTRQVRSSFGRAFYHRFYASPDTPAVEPYELELLVDHVLAYLRYLDLDVTRVLDLGCGLGLWQSFLKARLTSLDYTGVEMSDTLCRDLGWTHASLSEFKSRRKYDLIICQSVFQYIPGQEVTDGLRNMARLCRGAMYLEVVTREDWDRNCDQTATDGAIHLRSVSWYRKRIARYFVNCGGGLFVPRHASVVLYELEHDGR